MQAPRLAADEAVLLSDAPPQSIEVWQVSSELRTAANIPQGTWVSMEGADECQASCNWDSFLRDGR